MNVFLRVGGGLASAIASLPLPQRKRQEAQSSQNGSEGNSGLNFQPEQAGGPVRTSTYSFERLLCDMYQMDRVDKLMRQRDNLDKKSTEVQERYFEDGRPKAGSTPDQLARAREELNSLIAQRREWDARAAALRAQGDACNPSSTALRDGEAPGSNGAP